VSADDQVAELIGESLVWTRRGAIGRAGGPDEAKPNDLGELTDGLEQRPAAWAQIADLIAAPRPVETVVTGLAFEMRHPAPFRVEVIGRVIHDN
jgi:hypothetical protein